MKKHITENIKEIHQIWLEIIKMHVQAEAVDDFMAVEVVEMEEIRKEIHKIGKIATEINQRT